MLIHNSKDFDLREHISHKLNIEKHYYLFKIFAIHLLRIFTCQTDTVNLINVDTDGTYSRKADILASQFLQT